VSSDWEVATPLPGYQDDDPKNDTQESPDLHGNQSECHLWLDPAYDARFQRFHSPGLMNPGRWPGLV
jgi:hypothetical protein